MQVKKGLLALGTAVIMLLALAVAYLLGVQTPLLQNAAQNGASPEGLTTSQATPIEYSSGSRLRSSNGSFDIVALFRDNPAQSYDSSLENGDSIDVLSSVPRNAAPAFLKQVREGPNFAGKYRIIELPDEESEKLFYIVDYEKKRGRELPAFEKKIGANLFFTSKSLALLLLHLDYPSGDCTLSGFVFDEFSGDFEHRGTKVIADDTSCTVEFLDRAIH